MTWWTEIPERAARQVETDSLSFDHDNPRYAAENGLPFETEADIISYLVETADLGELLQSISTSGYLDIEPLIVMGKGAQLIVLEGNRRLAAIKLLRNPTLGSELGISVPVIPDKLRQTTERITIYRVQTRDDARDFIGFKHINGAHRWDSVAKARYAAQWYRAEKAKGEHGLTLANIAQRMGDRHSTLQRMISGLFVLEQARDKGIYDTSDRWPGRQFAFSHLYTALTRPGYRRFLGLNEDGKASDAEPQQNPVPEESLPQLKFVLTWLYGNEADGIRPVIRSQNPDIKNLGEVLENPKARKIMLESSDLERAYAEVYPPRLQLENHVVELHGASEKVMSKISAFDGQDVTLFDLVKEALSNVEVMVSVMSAKVTGFAKKSSEGRNAE